MLKSFDYKIISVMCMLMLSITSCVSRDGDDVAKPTTIRLSLGTGSETKTVKTRTSGTIPSDNGANVGQNEGTINTVCVGLFDADGNTITIHEYTYTNGQSESILTTTQVTQMIVEANVPSGLFAGATTIGAFQSRVQQLSYTTSNDGLSKIAATTAGGQTMTALPMTSGIVSPLSLSGNGTTSKTVELTRVVARVSISNVTTSFDSNGPYAGATFTPTEIFMYNANDQYTWSGTASASATTVSGESTASTSFAYLGTGTANYVAPASTTPQFFYVFPHSSTSPTKLVIRGTFTPSGGTAQTMYYPIVINHAQSNTTFTDASGNTTTNTNDATIEANKAYNIAVTITGLGVTDPSLDINPSAVTINSQVQDWTQTPVTINMNDVPGIGEYYFSDGSWGSLTDYPTKTPIGVVFSTRISDKEKQAGYIHGYALALQDANTTGCYWSTNGNDLSFLNDMTPCPSSYYNDINSGYIGTFANSLGTNSNYPAWYYAYQYKNSVQVPQCSSGWYLPTSGQWWDIMANLGKADLSSFIGSTTTNEAVQYVSSTTLSNINSYMTAISGGTAISSGSWYWSSSQVTSIGAVYVELYDNSVCISGAGDQYVKYGAGGFGLYKIRAIIAF